ELMNGSRYKCEAASDDGGRGLSVTDLAFDELRQQRDWDSWSALTNTTNARFSSQTIAVSNAGTDKRSEEHTSELQSRFDLVCRLLCFSLFPYTTLFRSELMNGSRYKCEAASDDAGRGLSVTDLAFDELRQQRDWDSWSALTNTTNARFSSQTIAVSNAGTDKSNVLRGDRKSVV